MTNIDHSDSESLPALIPRIYPYFRHPITTVRLSVVRTISSLLRQERLPRAWITPQTMHLIYRNILLEQREGVRDLSLQAWSHALVAIVSANAYNNCIEPNIQEWFALALKPTILGYDAKTFVKAEVGFSKNLDAHDIDKGVMTPDFSLVDETLVFRNRVDAVIALAQIASLAYSDVSAMEELLLRKLIPLRLASGHFWGLTLKLFGLYKLASIDFMRRTLAGMGARKYQESTGAGEIRESSR